MNEPLRRSLEGVVHYVLVLNLILQCSPSLLDSELDVDASRRHFPQSFPGIIT